MGGFAPQSPQDLSLFLPEWMIFPLPVLRRCLIIGELDRRIGQRRDATRAPTQVRNGWRPSGRLLVTPPHHLSDGQNLSNLWGPPQAPRLWTWSGGERVTRIVVEDSADAFLNDLRAVVWRAFIERLHRESKATYAALTGKDADSLPMIPATVSSDDLYTLHLDVCGVPRGLVARKKWPDATMQTLGAVQIGLMRAGAAIEGNHFVLDGTRIRIVYGQGRLLSDILKLYQEESTEYTSAEITICVGAKDDGGVPADVVRGRPSKSTIVRTVSLSQWQTEEDTKHLWAGGEDVIIAAY